MISKCRLKTKILKKNRQTKTGQVYYDVGLATDPELIWHKILEVKEMKHQIREETWPVIDQFFREMPEAIGKISTFQEALRQSALSTEHRLVIRQLRRKFPKIPTNLVQHVEATIDIEQLDNWLDQIMSANELAEIDFKILPQNQDSQQK